MVFDFHDTSAKLQGKGITPEVIEYVKENTFTDCDPPLYVHDVPALWCFDKNHPLRHYALVLFDEATVRRIDFEPWQQSAAKAKDLGIELAKIVFYHQAGPVLTAEYGKRWLTHVRHDMKPGLWEIDQLYLGEGINSVANGVTKYVSCIRDGGPDVRSLLPESIEGCKIEGEQVPEQFEKTAVTCGKNGQRHLWFEITYKDSEHYDIAEQEGFNGEGSQRPSHAHWASSDCSVFAAFSEPQSIK